MAAGTDDDGRRLVKPIVYWHGKNLADNVGHVIPSAHV
ncbi:hypothetical protein ACCUM_2643 [Candidatus Accumulibacter phosphatis]|uniref:Uncharacterized protein n=1 Tax=Candidatus Accumulibacter phosphatis TaxID=327160 RepID=A0A5S4EQQ9_9PROT|nr:hypothetical protein ACCUM_2643 [Candidatus Accumulibacter phosphatis]